MAFSGGSSDCESPVPGQKPANPPTEHAVRIRIHIHVNGHSDPYIVDLRLLVICGDPDVRRPNREQRLPRLNSVPWVDLTVLDVSGPAYLLIVVATFAVLSVGVTHRQQAGAIMGLRKYLGRFLPSSTRFAGPAGELADLDPFRQHARVPRGRQPRSEQGRR